MYLSLIFMPLLSAAFVGLLGRFLGVRGSSVFSVFCIGFSFNSSILVFFEVALCESPCYLQLAGWINSGLFDSNWGFQFDTLTSCMLFIVTLISFLVHIYSLDYMGHDPHIIRFLSYLSFFTFFMLLLVTGDNFIVMFLGWEGVGLCSYLLINFWYTRTQANKAAIKAMVVNRVGDLGFALGILGVFFVFKSVNFSVIFGLVPLFLISDFYFLFSIDPFFCMFDFFLVICLLLFIGAVGKSAQLGLHTWLPDAMEGPTPVSALIHAATMVTAGVFMIARCSPLFEQSSSALSFVCVLGALTAFFAATTGLVQNDLKKVIAYSTCSQLGYMIFACGLSNYSVSIFHLMNHAYFKALLFLSAGSVIHALADEQDMRLMGGLRQLLPFTYTMIMIGSLSLMGFPFLTGFYSKDVVLEVAYVSFSVTGVFAHWLGCISAFFTAFYSFRLIYLTFLRDSNSLRPVLVGISETSFLMGLVLIILAFGSIFIGYLTSDMVLGLGSPFFGNSLFISANHFNLVEAEFLSYFIKLVPVIFSILGAISALFLYFITFSYLFLLKLGLKNVYLFLNKKWFFDKVYNYFLISKIMRFGYYVSYKLMDKGLVEMFGPLGLVRMFTFFSFRVSLLQTGFIYQYIFFMFVGLILFLGVFYLIPFFLYFYSFIFLISTPLCFIFFITFVVLALWNMVVSFEQ